MDQNSLDNIFKEALYNHQSSLDQSALWSAIEGKKRKNKFMIVIMSLVSMSVLFGSFILINPTTIFNSNNPSANQSKTLIPITPNNQEQTNITHNSEENDEAKSKEAAQSQQLLSYKLKEELPKVKHNIKQQEKTKETIIRGSKIKEVARQSSLGTNSISSSIPSELTSKSLDKSNLFATNKTQEQAINPQEYTATHTAETKNDEALPVSLSLVHQSIKDKFSLLGLEENNLPKLSRKNKKIECYDYGPTRDNLAVEIYGSGDYIFNSMNTSIEFQDYLTERNISQIQLEGYRSGIRFKLSLKRGIYFKAGIESGWIRERFKYITSIDKLVFEEQVTIINTGTQIDTLVELVPVPNSETKIWDIGNTYKSFGIPLLIGYENNFRSFTYGIDIGAIYNFKYDFEGWLLDPTNTPIEVTDDYFENRIDYSLTGGVNIGYNLTPKLNTFLSLSFKKNMSDINLSSNLINQRHTHIGLGVGVSLKL